MSEALISVIVPCYNQAWTSTGSLVPSRVQQCIGLAATGVADKRLVREMCPLLNEIEGINRSPHEHFVFIDDARLFMSPRPPLTR